MSQLANSIHISFILVFLEGILSFFSPCVIPLLPVYISYLAGSAKTEKDGKILYQQKKVFFQTIFFILGISAAFVLLGTSFTLLGKLLNGHKYFFVRASGILIVLLGLFQLDFFHFSFLQKERKLHFNLAERKVNPALAFLLGFTFSFAWTPCIGPALSSVLILVSSAKTELTGFLLLLVYAAGFIIPFLLLGLFTTQALNFLKKRQKIIQYTIKLGGILLILIGIMTFTGFMNGITSYLNTATLTKDTKTAAPESTVSDAAPTITGNESSGESQKEDSSTSQEIDFSLTDQNGNQHTLSDYKGKVVFLNFYATWCPPCNQELPDIEKLYQQYGFNQKDVIFLGVTNPKSDDYPDNADEDIDSITSFIKEKNLTFPTLFDETGEIMEEYGISAFPTTFIIDKDGNILGYVPGMMTEDIMKNVINQALDKDN